MGDEDIDKWLTGLLDKLSDEKFLDFLDDFTTKHCDQFEEGEFSLSCTDIHNQVRFGHRSGNIGNCLRNIDHHLGNIGHRLGNFCPISGDVARTL